MKNLIKLYVVNYCEMETLEMQRSIQTHSREKAIKLAKHLKDKNYVLYSQVVEYGYNGSTEYYEFITLNNYYK